MKLMGTINCIVSCFIYLLTFMKLYVFKYLHVSIYVKNFFVYLNSNFELNHHFITSINLVSSNLPKSFRCKEKQQ